MMQTYSYVRGAIMKRIAVFALLCLLVLTPLVAQADMLLEPEDDFYRQHQSRIIYLGRSFAASGEGGSVPVKRYPGAVGDAATLQNGIIAYMQYSCLYDGDFWGFTSEYAGWVKLEQMLVLYDYVAFEEDHFGELYLYSGDYARIKETGAAIAWPWPGADAPIWTVEGLDADSFRVTYAYMDEEGREWGFVTYLYGNRYIWVCLSDPLNRDIPAFNPAPQPDKWESETVHIDIRHHMDEQGNESTVVIIILALVTLLVAGTALLIRLAWKPSVESD